jgi:hypothetical protein
MRRNPNKIQIRFDRNFRQWRMYCGPCDSHNPVRLPTFFGFSTFREVIHWYGLHLRYVHNAEGRE